MNWAANKGEGGREGRVSLGFFWVVVVVADCWLMVWRRQGQATVVVVVLDRQTGGLNIESPHLQTAYSSSRKRSGDAPEMHTL